MPRKDKMEAFGELLDVMDTLRKKCPWDRKQTLESLRMLTIEEMYELADAITERNQKALKEELGDIMLHLVFYARICEENGWFHIGEVIRDEIAKLKHRHPHIYGDVKVSSEAEVKQNWEKLKLKEGKKSILSGVPASLPALVKAYRIQDKAKQVGFEWETLPQVWDKVEEEINEFKSTERLSTENFAKLEEEFGDVLFALVNYARFLHIDPELALERTNKKFIARFQFIEEQAARKGVDLEQMTLEEMDALWNEAKAKGI